MFSKNILSIDIGTYSTKFVLGQYKNNTLIVRKAFFLPTPSNATNDGQIIDLLKLKNLIEKAIRKGKIKTKKVVFTLESTSVITRELLLPSVKSKDLEEMLEYEIQQYFPTTLEDYIIQYKKLEETDKEGIKQSRILVGALPKRIVESYFELLKVLKLKPFALDLHSNALSKLFKEQRTINHEPILEDDTIGMIDIGYENINIYIIRGGIPQFSRLLPVGGKDLDINITNAFNLSAEEGEMKKRYNGSLKNLEENNPTSVILQDIIRSFVDQWIEEIQRIFKFYTSRNLGNKIDKIYLHGGHANLEGISYYIGKYFNIPTMKIKEISNIKILEKKENFDIDYYLNAIGGIIRK